MNPMLPTEEAYGELQLAYDHFNRTLFDGELPACLITFQREKRTYGYFSHARFESEAGKSTDEIAINPAYFAVVPIVEIMQTLAHEMVHLWQAHFGTPGRRGYHNREWADKMEAIGLMPSDTGQPGGRKVGEKMADYPQPGGAFAAACAQLLTDDFTITWRDRLPSPPLRPMVDPGTASAAGPAIADVQEDKSNRKKYTCPSCGSNTWGKPGMKLICGECRIPLAAKGQPVLAASSQPEASATDGAVMRSVSVAELVAVPPSLTASPLPLYLSAVSAGFPSPADDHIERTLDLNEHLIRNKEATFFVRVSGRSMTGVGILDGDILVVDRSIEPMPGKIVVAAVNGELTVKTLVRKSGKVWLAAENPDYAPLEMKDGMECVIWGVVTSAIHAL